MNTQPILAQPEWYTTTDPLLLDEARRRPSAWRVSDQPPRPFDEAACIALALEAKAPEGRVQHRADVRRITEGWRETIGAISREELAFWASLLLEPDYVSASQLSASFTKDDVRQALGKLTPEAEYQRYFELLRASTAPSNERYEVFARLLLEVAPYLEVLAFIFETVTPRNWGDWLPWLGLPPEADREQAEQLLVAAVNASELTLWLNGNMCRIISAIPRQKAIVNLLDIHVEEGRDWERETFDVAYLLEDDAQRLEFLQNAYRTGRTAPREEDVREVWRFFAHYGHEHLDVLVEQILGHFRNSYEFTAVLDAITTLKHPDVVALMVKLSKSEHLLRRIEEYLYTGERYALEGLLRLCEKKSARRDWALDHLRALLRATPSISASLTTLAAAHHPKGVQKLVAKLIDEVRATLATEDEARRAEEARLLATRPAPLSEQDHPVWMARLSEVLWPRGGAPAWLDLDALPPLTLATSGAPVPRAVVDGMFAVCKWLHHKSNEHIGEARIEVDATVARWRAEGQTWLDALAAEVDAEDLDALLAAAIVQFDEALRYSEEELLWLLPLWTGLGDFTVAYKLWIVCSRFMADRHGNPTASFTALCEQLLRMRCDEGRWAALRFFDAHVAQTPSPNLLLVAEFERVCDAYCTQRGITREELEDIAIPSWGLDTRGERVFDLGTRQVSFRLESRDELRFIEQENGKEYASFPRSKKTDDPSRFALARARYDQFSWPMRHLFGEQAARLERAMIQGKSWRYAWWREHVATGHVVVSAMAHRLLWEVLDARGELVARALLDASGDLMNLEAERVSPAEDHRLRLAHPASLSANERAAWSEQLATDELIQPFDQLSRELYLDASPEQVNALFASSFTNALIAQLWQLGWTYEAMPQGDDAVHYRPPNIPSPVEIRISRLSPLIWFSHGGRHGDQTFTLEEVRHEGVFLYRRLFPLRDEALGQALERLPVMARSELLRVLAHHEVA